MSEILLQATLCATPDDWDITRFSLLADVLRDGGHTVTARNRSPVHGQDPVLGRLDQSQFDQLWLIAADTGTALSDLEAAAIQRFRMNGGGVLVARDHENLGSSIARVAALADINRFRDDIADVESLRDDQDNRDIAWPNYHSGANGDYQPVLVEGRPHELLQTPKTSSGHIEWFPAHPHEGCVRAGAPGTVTLAQGRSLATGRRFNLAVIQEGAPTAEGSRTGRVLAESSFHHFADYNWDVSRGAPSFVTESPGAEITSDPSRLEVFLDYVHNIATWLHPSHTGTTCKGTP